MSSLKPDTSECLMCDTVKMFFLRSNLYLACDSTKIFLSFFSLQICKNCKIQDGCFSTLNIICSKSFPLIKSNGRACCLFHCVFLTKYLCFSAIQRQQCTIKFNVYKTIFYSSLLYLAYLDFQLALHLKTCIFTIEALL